MFCPVALLMRKKECFAITKAILAGSFMTVACGRDGRLAPRESRDGIEEKVLILVYIMQPPWTKGCYDCKPAARGLNVTRTESFLKVLPAPGSIVYVRNHNVPKSASIPFFFFFFPILQFSFYLLPFISYPCLFPGIVLSR